MCFSMETEKKQVTGIMFKMKSNIMRRQGKGLNQGERKITSNKVSQKFQTGEPVQMRNQDGSLKNKPGKELSHEDLSRPTDGATEQ